MNEMIRILFDPDIPFFRYAFILGLLSGPAFGITGSYIVTRRITYIAGAISHSVLGGIGAALFLNGRFGLAWCTPMTGAVVSGFFAAFIIGLASIHSSQREDTIIGAVWAIGMATGLLFIAGTPGYVDPMSYLFGNILLITLSDIWLIAGFNVLMLLVVLLFYNKLLAVCFDPGFSELRGIRVNVYYILLLCLTALAIVLLVRMVGIIMVIAMLTLPAATAGLFCRKLGTMMIAASLLCAIQSCLGLGAGFMLNLPVGPVIIVVAGLTYPGALVIRQIKIVLSRRLSFYKRA